MDNVRLMVEPDPAQMRRHVGHLFEGWLDGAQHGRVELAWTDARDGRLTHAKLFGTDELDELVACALAENRKPGQNVYIGQALRRPETTADARCRDDDFFALTALYIDIDDDVTATAAVDYRNRGCPPTAVIITGRHPHVRAQMVWRLEEPIRDADIARRQNLALAHALKGDTSVINPGRVLRLGGSIAWPLKPGRVLERTDFIDFSDGRPKVYLLGQIARAFPPVTQEAVEDTSAPALNIGSDRVSVEAALQRIRRGDHWHTNLVRLTGHWIARGWSDAEILTASDALTLPGYTIEETRREVGRMIASGREKWAVPNPTHEVVEPTVTAPLVATFLDQLNLALLPQRRWLIGRSLLRGHVTILVAPPGVGKSTLSVARAVALATGRALTGETVHEQVKTWVYNVEDDADELKRRLGAVLLHGSIPFAEVRDRVALNSGADRPLLFATADRSGAVIRHPDVDACIAEIKAHNIGCLIVDPFVETHEVDENANGEIKKVAALYREIARATNCAVLLVHHTAKPPQGTSDGHAGNMNTARGASALVGVARVVQTLFAMSEKDAERFGIPDEERPLYVRLDDAKANLSLIDGEATWFRRVGVELANGDEVGVLEPCEMTTVEPDSSIDEPVDLHRTIIGCLLGLTTEPEITLNAAAIQLAWSETPLFHRYRQLDKQGHQRAKRSMRDAILAACRSKIEIVTGGLARGFSCDETLSPVRLKRFARRLDMQDLANRPVLFEEDLK